MKFMKVEKASLLSIGELSKMTGAGVKALRHYEKLDLLTPVYVDEFTGYRYYRFSQTIVVELIKFAVELGIPLKEVTAYLSQDGDLEFGAFIARGRALIEQKMEVLQKALKLFNSLDGELAAQNLHQLDEIYERKFPRKIAYVVPHVGPFDEIDKQEVAKFFMDMPYEYDDGYETDWVDYGFYAEHSAGAVSRFAFVEVSAEFKRKNPAFLYKYLPAGKYMCRQSDEAQIEQAESLFADYLAGSRSFLAIDSEVFSSKFNVNQPINELRVIIR
jgi:DNA-binding transcriptional MerR regulator